MAGALGWGLVTQLTGYEIGLIAVAVGWLVGGAVRLGSKGLGGKPFQALAVALTYLAIVSHYAAKAGVRAPAPELREAALRWALRRSSRSGRTARQFIDDFAGRESIRSE